MQFPTPRSLAELQRFVGSLNYYLSYIPNLARIARPLYAITKSAARWTWEEEHQGAFDRRKRKLVEEPICLAFPDWEKEIYFEADASSEGIVPVISQRDEKSGTLRSINFSSSSLSSSQRNYSAGQLEAWALVVATRKRELYLKSAPEVILVTYHKPLQWLREQRDLRHTFARWLLELEEIPYQTRYRHGTQNQLPDYLSRITGLGIDQDVSSEEPFENKIYQQVPEDWTKKIKFEQRNDRVIQEAIQADTRARAGFEWAVQENRSISQCRRGNIVFCYKDCCR